MAKKKLFTDEQWRQLDEMAKIHCTGEEMAAIIGVDYDTMNARIVEKFGCQFSEWYKKHASEGKKCLRRKQYEKAIEEGNVPLLIWLGKQMLGQTDKIEQDNKESVTINADFFSAKKDDNNSDK